MASNSKLLVGFILGAAAGAALGVFLTSDKGKELIADLKDAAGKFSDEVKETINKGKAFADDLEGAAEQA
ncbi:MAG: YtxH domain-containing protein [Chitinophagaceae bacterium]